MVWYGVVWRVMVWYGVVWYGMVWYVLVYGMVPAMQELKIKDGTV